jgi:hypothetical protein
VAGEAGSIISSIIKHPFTINIILVVVGGFVGAFAHYVFTRPQCVPNSVFLEDISIPDGTVIGRGELFEKQWKIRNPEGSRLCTWNKEYNAVWTNGPKLANRSLYYIPATAPGTDVIVRIPMKAPDIPGEYKSTWMLRTETGKKFGDRFWVIIIVK